MPRRRWVIVGAGAAGCAVAARLGDAGADVAVIEAGPAEPAGSSGWDGLRVTRVAGGASGPYLQGYGVGGSSLINAGVVVAGEPLDRVADVLPRWRPDDLGPVGRALAVAAPDAAVVELIRRDGERVTAAEVLLAPAVARGNVRVAASAPVASVAIEARRAVGVVLEGGRHVEADEVVVCAGAIGTASLLLRSGVDTPGVGDGLQDHPAVALTLALGADHRGSTAEPITVTVERPRRQILSINRLDGAPHHGALLAALMDPVSTGRVRLPDRDAAPVVEFDLLSDPADQAVMVRIVRELIELADSRPIRQITTDVLVDDVGTPVSRLARDEDALLRWMRTRIGGYFHAAASCRRGVVTDHAGCVRGYGQLRIADASLFERVPPRNPYLATIVQAHRLASGWVERPAPS